MGVNRLRQFAVLGIAIIFGDSAVLIVVPRLRTRYRALQKRETTPIAAQTRGRQVRTRWIP